MENDDKLYNVMDEHLQDKGLDVVELVNEMISDGWLKIEDETMLDDNRKW
jgi:hypothetical protein